MATAPTAATPAERLAAVMGVRSLLKPTEKLVIITRHARSQMNELKMWPDFVDPIMFDTDLSEDGVATATALQWFPQALHDAGLRPEAVVVSPLRRTYRTAKLVLGSLLASLPISVLPCNAEPISDSGDVGRPIEELAAEFPELPLDGIPSLWWYPGPPRPDGSVPATGAEAHAWYREHAYEEPDAVTAARAVEWRRCIAARPESFVWVFSHGDIAKRLTGVPKIRNLAMMVCALDRVSAELRLVHLEQEPAALRDAASP